MLTPDACIGTWTINLSSPAAAGDLRDFQGCHTVYRYHAGDRLLYVGISDDLANRTASHRAKKPWYPTADTLIVETYPSRIEAEIREWYLVRMLAPLHNRSMAAGRGLGAAKTAHLRRRAPHEPIYRDFAEQVGVLIP